MTSRLPEKKWGHCNLLMVTHALVVSNVGKHFIIIYIKYLLTVVF